MNRNVVYHNNLNKNHLFNVSIIIVYIFLHCFSLLLLLLLLTLLPINHDPIVTRLCSMGSQNGLSFWNVEKQDWASLFLYLCVCLPLWSTRYGPKGSHFGLFECAKARIGQGLHLMDGFIWEKKIIFTSGLSLRLHLDSKIGYFDSLDSRYRTNNLLERFSFFSFIFILFKYLRNYHKS